VSSIISSFGLNHKVGVINPAQYFEWSQAEDSLHFLLNKLPVVGYIDELDYLLAYLMFKYVKPDH
jgi:hypothetical protein